ncbi:hypothetical protein ES708_34198 [subsurface metagenome]
MRPFHRLFYLRRAVVMRRTFVQDHDNIGAQPLLIFNGQLRGDMVLAAVDVGTKGHPVVAYLAQRRKAENLVAPAVGEYRPLPPHKVM